MGTKHYVPYALRERHRIEEVRDERPVAIRKPLEPKNLRGGGRIAYQVCMSIGTCTVSSSLTDVIVSVADCTLVCS